MDGKIPRKHVQLVGVNYRVLRRLFGATIFVPHGFSSLNSGVALAWSLRLSKAVPLHFIWSTFTCLVETLSVPNTPREHVRRAMR